MQPFTVWMPRPGSRFVLPPFPTGWYSVSFSEDLPRGGVIPVEAFGEKLVLYRGDDGIARLFGAFCPHLGAHLGHGGRVEGAALRCPFHAWRFDETGACTDIPYARKVPAGARIEPWSVREQDGHVLAWFDRRGGEPAWTPDPVAEVGDEGWIRVGRRRVEIRAHIQDLAENAVDSAHFQFVHGAPLPPATSAESDGHVLRARSVLRYPEALGGMEGTLQVRMWGLGLSASRFSGLVDTLVHGATTPIDEGRAETRLSMWTRRLDGDMTSMVAEMFVAEVNRQIEHDLPIWENKVMVQRPLLCDGDGPIGVFRRWARGFYRDLPEAEAR
jgi:nitrite reductase/ring-hydroxylating ferredoxin subunit